MDTEGHDKLGIEVKPMTGRTQALLRELGGYTEDFKKVPAEYLQELLVRYVGEKETKLLMTVLGGVGITDYETIEKILTFDRKLVQSDEIKEILLVYETWVNVEYLQKAKVKVGTLGLREDQGVIVDALKELKEVPLVRFPSGWAREPVYREPNPEGDVFIGTATAPATGITWVYTTDSTTTPRYSYNVNSTSFTITNGSEYANWAKGVYSSTK